MVLFGLAPFYLRVASAFISFATKDTTIIKRAAMHAYIDLHFVKTRSI